MAKHTYAAMIEEADGGYGISFPDLPGCVSYAETMADAAANAEEALSLHLEGMAEDGQRAPEPAWLGDTIAAQFSRPNAPRLVWMLVTVEGPEESDRVNVYLPKSLVERIDNYARDAGMNRSSVFGLAARRLLAEGHGKGPPGGQA